ncbi:acetyltransferase [Vibrio vulnificus]|nr:acetyltransferase [Vibrio vulnificus]
MCYALSAFVRCSPLNAALCKYSNQPIFQCLGLGYWRK